MESEALEFLNLFSPVLTHLSHLSSAEAFREPHVRGLLDGLFRDLRGFVSAIELSEAKSSYLVFFMWFYPHMGILLRGIEANFDNTVAIVGLKLVSELVLNRAQFMQLLLTCASTILKNTLAGNYVHFGVFDLYNDPALDIALDVVFQMMMNIPIEDLMSFPKLTLAFFNMIDVFSKGQLLKMKDISLQAIEYIFRATAEGIRGSDKVISTASCNTVENICTFLFNEQVKTNTFILSPPPPGSSTPSPTSATLGGSSGTPTSAIAVSGSSHVLLQRFGAQPHLIHMQLRRILEAIVVEEANDWSLSRPLLPLVLLDRAYFDFFVGKLISGQLEQRQGAFQELMEGIQYNLHPINKNKFTQQVLTFRRNMMAQNFIILLPPKEEF
ncbi:Exportin 7 [Entophlyctis luteolus]|nr:Exportin 7 [Entophlyctis luteolus]